MAELESTRAKTRLLVPGGSKDTVRCRTSEDKEASLEALPHK
jgi:hypothetical protein